MMNKKFSYCLLLFLLLVPFAVTDDYGKANAQTAGQASDRWMIKGLVTDAGGSPLPGASVVLVGTTLGTVSAADGTYTLTIPRQQGSAKLQYKFVGYKPQVKECDRNCVLNVVLEEDASQMDEVVVIGYGQKNKKSLTSSISSINKKDIETLAPTASSVQDLLAGTVKGVLVSQSSGAPGAVSTINVRGITSPYPNMTTNISGNAPLYVIDGVPQFVDDTQSINPLQTLSPSEIESIDVLKDAAATAIYGSRGANGVIIVKTKSGRKGESTSVEFSYNFSVANPIKSYRAMDNAQFRKFQTQVMQNTADSYPMSADALMNYGEILGLYGNFSQNEDGTPVFNGLNESGFGTASTDWAKEVQNKNAATHQYSVSVRGGSSSTTYSMAFNASNQEGLFKNDDLNTYNGRINVESQLSTRVKVGALLNYSTSKRKSSETDTEADSKTWNVRPDVAPYDKDGKLNDIDAAMLYGSPGIYTPSPLALLGIQTESKYSQISGTAYTDIDIWKGLAFHADFNFLSFKSDNTTYTPATAVPDYTIFGMERKSTLAKSNGDNLTTSVNFRLDYTWNKEAHSGSAMVGYGSDRTKYKMSSSSYESLPSDKLNQPSAAAAYLGGTDYAYPGGLNSVYSRVSYDYNKQYFLDLSLRADESSKFGPNNRWGFFPAISGAWNIKETLMQRVNAFDDLKLRLSWGETGSTNVTDFSYKQYYGINELGNIYDGHSAVVLKSTLANPDLKWEKTDEWNVGIDFSLLKGRLFGSIDAYYRYTDGALAPAPHILESGMATYYANIIDMSNKGIEFSLGSTLIDGRDFNWITTLNLSINRNKVESLNGASLGSTFEDVIVLGQPVGVMKGYAVDRIAQSAADVEAMNKYATDKGKDRYDPYLNGAGNYIYKDVNGDGEITADDKVVIANPQPKFYGGWSNSFHYKSFSLQANFQYSVGGEAFYSALSTSVENPFMTGVVPELVGNSWTADNTAARYPILTAGNYYATRSYSDTYVFSTSYFRLKNVVLSYELPKSLLSKIDAESASVFVSAGNLFTITKWPGIDPETVGGSASPVTMSRNNDPYPLARSFMVGMNLKF